MDKYIYINNDAIRMYNPRTFGKRTEPCGPTVGDGYLMSGDGEFLDKDVINNKCACSKMDTCKMLVNLLKNDKVKEVKEIITREFLKSNK